MKKFKEWAKKTAIKTIKTMAQTALGSGISSAAILADVNWAFIGSAVIVSGIACVLMNIVDYPTD